MENKQYDVVALGELLIDFTENGTSSQGNPVFEANPGGAPCNVLAVLAKLGHKVSFIGKVGNDGFGRQLKNALLETGIDTGNLYMDDRVHTTLALVQTLPGGDRDFSFYREPGADMMLTCDEIRAEAVSNTKIFHYGTLSMTHDGVREATKKAIALAKDAGVILSFDPNLRPPLWSSMELAREQVLYGMSRCDIVKISDNEIQWLSGKDDYDAGIAWLRDKFPHITLVLLSMGPDGSRAYYKDLVVEVPAFLQSATIETTGAGDTFCGCMLHYICQQGLDDVDAEGLRTALTFANAAASLITTRKGALRVMPGAQEIETLMTKG